MAGVDQVDDLTFRVNFGGDGVEKLRERVKDKLKEFMGDYTDDTLVEYVIVLLKNGRRKVEAKNELNVFLGDDSDSFVAWLWDHLGSNLDLYVQPGESRSEETVKTIPMPEGKNDSDHLDSEAERERSSKVSRSRHSREWKGLVRNTDEPPPLANANIEEGSHHKVGRVKQSSRQIIQRKRSRPDEQHQVKREVGSKATIGAPRRLPQFAVRDAVGTPRPSGLTTEPSLKRLRSVVSTSTEDHTQRIRPVARIPNTMAVAIKAVADAAKDVKRVKSSGNVFDRITPTADHITESREASIEDVEDDGKFGQIPEETHPTFRRRSNMNMSESDADNEGFDDVNVNRSVTDASQTGMSNPIKGDDSLMVQYSVAADNANEVTHKPWKDEDHQSAAIASSTTSSKIVNISVNVNSWKPHHYQEQKEASNMDRRKFVQDSEVGADKSGLKLMKENSSPVTVDNGKAVPAADTQREPQKTLPSTPGLYSTGRPTEDADSRTIFVSNVHFAATKDSLSRHFNKFGDVLKVVIVTDAATGQPKGSAYVEFMRKEAAEHALSLDGTSFMSRILKVVRKSAAHQEVGSMMTWPRVARGSPFAVSRFARVPFSRGGIPSIYRPRLPIKTGARSMQWKRDTPSEGSNTVPSPTARSLTYVRTDPKTNGN